MNAKSLKARLLEQVNMTGLDQTMVQNAFVDFGSILNHLGEIYLTMCDRTITSNEEKLYTLEAVVEHLDTHDMNKWTVEAVYAVLNEVHAFDDKEMAVILRFLSSLIYGFSYFFFNKGHLEMKYEAAMQKEANLKRSEEQDLSHHVEED